MKPTVGRIVIFKLDDFARDQIEGATKTPNPNNGADECPAVIVRVWGDECVNLRLLTDGPPCAVEWRTSALLGDQPGQWSWPPRV